MTKTPRRRHMTLMERRDAEVLEAARAHVARVDKLPPVRPTRLDAPMDGVIVTPPRTPAPQVDE
ncbi:MAG: hypothetical protein HQL38_16795 [Alphaproteobacteria bacterium]|nr:hypothetical protein [Alphaproteobacteria bacterium]MBF0394336.1 hypothetical protein [Alphaproteobacteria bacterium]